MAEIVQVISGEGEFAQSDVQQFVENNALAACKTNYQVVAIMGPQSSGKSTLLNHVFGTSFTMMDAMAGRGQTTKGIWMSKSPKVADTTVLVMDLEGSDGRERGEDDTNFERQSALFALAVADVLLVNIWCHDIGREHGSGKPLLKTIFQVNLKLFAPEPDRKKSVLLFVIRDKTRTPLPKLTEVLAADLERMWESIAKPAAYKDSKMGDFFEVKYAALSHFEERYEDFQADAVTLRRRFSPDGDDSLIHGEEKLPGDAFALSIRNIWEVIRSQKDLNLPAHKVMVANVRCEEIAAEQLRAFEQDQAWTALREEAGAGAVEGFGGRAAGLMDSCIRGYDAEALYFDASVREAKQGVLLERLLAALQPVYAAQVAAQQAAVMATFEKELRLAVAEGGGEGGFVAAAAARRAEALKAFAAAYSRHLRIEGTPWDGAAEQAALAESLDAYVARVRSERLAASLAATEKAMCSKISGPVMGLLETCAPGMWPRLHAVCRDASAAADRHLKRTLDGYGLSAAEAEELSAKLRARADTAVEGHVREAAHTRLSRMKDRFQDIFMLDESRAPRMWGPRDDVPAIAVQARLAAASVLSQLAVMRPEAAGAEQGDAVEAAVQQLARMAPSAGAASDASSSRSATGDTSGSGAAPAAGPALSATSSGAVDVLSAASWPGVPEECVLLQPHEVRTTWREFLAYSNALVQQALSAQQSNRLASNRMPPLWAIVMMLVLGWNEAMALLFNPLYLLLGALAFLFCRSLYTELDVEQEMAAGALPGALRLSHKFVPALQSVVRKTQSTVQQMLASPGPGPGEAQREQRAAAYAAGEDGSMRQRAGGEGQARRTASSSSGGPNFTDLRTESKKDL
ncbi:hypothetical protein GPECTOR_38g267 [Gonium pectorale]|uniref:Protein ROOT HAIR DEFECTIVE 3 homolog n=1 Tax=Gonium pectorale TaxID=33097 RepID=A0A150GCH0_GONPE|nr:hypothetical protein GPECTOR_38g267 [Gonium pectorale]|eukprot:KXZ47030.1 hypothetical protein GPECTOR_38g267 [Gonium pectorale]